MRFVRWRPDRTPEGCRYEQLDVASPVRFEDLLANPVAPERTLRLLFLGSGRQETGMLAPGQRVVRLLRDQGVNARWSDFPGGHVFSVWRNLLHESVPLLFTPSRP